jgi:tetratricopeptide (TPR) repeat protein
MLEPEMTRDAQGHELTGAGPEAAIHYDRAVRAFNLGYGDALAEFDAAREMSPQCVMASLGKAWLYALAIDPGTSAAARAIVETVRELPMNLREAAHLAALDLALLGEPTSAADVIDLHLMQHPRDILAHEVGFLLDLFVGRSRNLRDRPARALTLFPADLPGYPTLLAFHAFGLEETGDYARAEDQARQVAELEPLSFWAHHAVAHVMEMQGRPEDGLGWMLAREPLWSADEHVTQTHIWWHKSLFHVELGQHAAALALYDGAITATQRKLGVSLTNASALLWRLDLLGCDVGTRWAALADIWDGHADGRCCVFTDLHAAMAELGAGRDAAVQRRLDWMRGTSDGNGETASLYRQVGLRLVQGFRAFAQAQYADAAALLHPVRFATQRIGGSHAQRDIVDWTLTEAALRGGQRDMAVALAHERLALRPRSAVNRAFLQRAEGLAA